jgi:hypothetical protein
MIQARVAADRPHASQMADHGGADGRRGAQDAEALGADMQHVAGEHRQQGGGPAQQHREQVERDRAEDDLVAPDIGQALLDQRDARAGLRSGLVLVRMRAAIRAADQVDHHRGREGVGGETAHRRPPMAGPRIEPLCQAREFQAMARGRSSRGTSIGPMAPEAGE